MSSPHDIMKRIKMEEEMLPKIKSFFEVEEELFVQTFKDLIKKSGRKLNHNLELTLTNLYKEGRGTKDKFESLYEDYKEMKTVERSFNDIIERVESSETTLIELIAEVILSVEKIQEAVEVEVVEVVVPKKRAEHTWDDVNIIDRGGKENFRSKLDGAMIKESDIKGKRK